MEATEVRVLNWPEAPFWQSSLFGVIVGALLGALLAGVVAYIMYAIQNRRQKREQTEKQKALVTVLATEAVLIFKRCTQYCRQWWCEEPRVVSFSTLFRLSDAGLLTRVAETLPDPLLSYRLFMLQEIYHQVMTNLDRVQYCIDEDTGKTTTEFAEFFGTATIFFRNSYEKAVEHTQALIDSADSLGVGELASQLKRDFEEAKQTYEEARPKIEEALKR